MHPNQRMILDLADEELEKVKPQKDGDDEFLALLEADLEDDEDSLELKKS